MTELANTTKQELSTLESLAIQAKTCVLSARLNLLQLGRVLTEAKPLVRHGEWEVWVKENAQMSVRAAQSYMQAYATFGLNPEIAKLGSTKTMKLLPLSDEERSALFEENDVGAMSTRQLDEAIRKQKEKLRKEIRAEVNEEIERERAARIEAEERAQKEEERAQKEIERRIDIQREASKSLRDSDKRQEDQEQKIKDLSNNYKAAEKERARLASENQRLEEENRDQAELLEEQQADYNRIQEELLNVKSSIAKGDAERVPVDRFTPGAFASAVRAFIGSCARMPHMAAAFSCMSTEERNEYDELLRTVETWAENSRKALNSEVIVGEVLVHE